MILTSKSNLKLLLAFFLVCVVLEVISAAPPRQQLKHFRFTRGGYGNRPGSRFRFNGQSKTAFHPLRKQGTKPRTNFSEREAKFYTTRFGKRGDSSLNEEVPDAIGEILSAEDAVPPMTFPLGRPPSVQSRNIEGKTHFSFLLF